MEPYYKSWQQSSHKDVTCIECHFPPGVGGKVRGKMLGLVQLAKYVTASAGPAARGRDPRRQLPPQRLPRDAAALRPGRFPTAFTFDHTPHLEEGRRGKTLRCTSCHSQIVQGQHMTVTTIDLLPLPLQGPAVQRGAQRLHALPSDSREGVRPGRRREVHARTGLPEGRRLRELPRRPDPRQRRRAPRALPLLPQPRGRPGARSATTSSCTRYTSPSTRSTASSATRPSSTVSRTTRSNMPRTIASRAIPTTTRSRSTCSTRHRREDARRRSPT